MRIEIVCLVSKGIFNKNFRELKTFQLNKIQDRYFLKKKSSNTTCL